MKVTETTPPNQRKFTLELNEAEACALHTLVTLVDKWHEETDLAKTLRGIEIAFGQGKVPYAHPYPFAAGGSMGCLLRTVPT